MKITSLRIFGALVGLGALTANPDFGAAAAVRSVLTALAGAGRGNYRRCHDAERRNDDQRGQEEGAKAVNGFECCRNHDANETQS